ncbi:MAG: DUF1573 domain-containing protein [Chitinophagales bacterium]|nr:DUF1573 domain-containing protein [Chitinophagales bacterium]MDW8394395.1 DUF1573 domain-containing protein [Chitinophagales bacterium]
MKVLFVLLLFAALACQNPAPEKVPMDGSLVRNPGLGDEELLPEMSFKNRSFDFGALTEGEEVTHDFWFTNTGRAPLIISEVQSGCGCTTPVWPKGAVKVGDSAYIRVVYNSKNQTGEFSKNVVVIANTYPNKTTLKVTGVVIKKPKTQSP